MYGLTHPNCKKKYGLDGVMSLFYYNNFLKKVIKAVKYRLASAVWDDFSRLIDPTSTLRFSTYISLSDQCVLTPIPLHTDRLKERGFNQAELICTWLGAYLHTPTRILISRQLHTHPQAQIHDNAQRHKNVHNAFRLLSKADIPTSVILVDDVITTGSTIIEATKVLKEAGVKKVFAITIARG